MMFDDDVDFDDNGRDDVGNDDEDDEDVRRAPVSGAEEKLAGCRRPPLILIPTPPLSLPHVYCIVLYKTPPFSLLYCTSVVRKKGRRPPFPSPPCIVNCTIYKGRHKMENTPLFFQLVLFIVRCKGENGPSIHIVHFLLKIF